MGSFVSDLSKCGGGGPGGGGGDDDLKEEMLTPDKGHTGDQHADAYKDLEAKFAASMKLKSAEQNDLYGYHFTLEGELVDQNGCPYRSRKQGTRAEDADLYHKLCDGITRITQESLVNVFDLLKIPIPIDATEDEPRSFIFASRDALTTTGKLLILIHGSGGVNAGLWSRKVILHDNLYRGSQLPYVDRAISEGYEIVILNTNVNSKLVECDSWVGEAPIRGSDSPQAHALHVWDNFIHQSQAKHIAIVAHSYGGVVTMELACRRKEQFLRRVFSVAFTDSAHSVDLKRTPKEVVVFLCNKARNWVTSNLPLDTPVGKNAKRPLSDAPKVSAGDTRHEWTSHSAYNSVFLFFKEKLNGRSPQMPNSTGKERKRRMNYTS